MRLPSANTWVCSVAMTAQKGAPFSGVASMLSIRIPIIPDFRGRAIPGGPLMAPGAESGDVWAATLATCTVITIRERAVIFKRMMCFLLKVGLSIFDSDGYGDFFPNPGDRGRIGHG